MSIETPIHQAEESLIEPSSHDKLLEIWLAKFLEARLSKFELERLEFLGDAALGFEIAQELFSKFSERPSSFLTNSRSELVRNETLRTIVLNEPKFAQASHTYQFKPHDTFEALVGFVCLHGKQGEVKQLLQLVLHEPLSQIDEQSLYKPAKTELLEILRSHKGDYTFTSCDGKTKLDVVVGERAWVIEHKHPVQEKKSLVEAVMSTRMIALLKTVQIEYQEVATNLEEIPTEPITPVEPKPS